jgi:serine/threonine-protein kinase
VPDVTGQTSDAAVSTLNGAGLLAQSFEMYDDTVAEGSVITQYPEAGTEVLTGSSVAIVVSLGEEPSDDPDVVEIPDVVGVQAEEAIQTLEAEGLGVIPLESPDESAPEGQVVAQIPEAGAHVSEDSYVAIVVSSVPEPAGENAQ